MRAVECVWFIKSWNKTDLWTRFTNGSSPDGERIGVGKRASGAAGRR